jgi:hypothetical protein
MTINEICLIILEKLYDKMRDEGFGDIVDVSEIKEKYDLKENDFQTALVCLEKKGFIKAYADNEITLKQEGIEAYENRNVSGTPLYQMNQYVIQAGRDISTGDIQQGSINIMKKFTYEQIYQIFQEEIKKSDLKDDKKKFWLSNLKELIPIIVEIIKKLLSGQIHI